MFFYSITLLTVYILIHIVICLSLENFNFACQHPHLYRDDLMPSRDEEEQEQPLTAFDNMGYSTGKNKWECDVCNKIFDSLYILNYHRLLEHSKYKRPPTGVG
jgi:hypothetical protein